LWVFIIEGFLGFFLKLKKLEKFVREINLLDPDNIGRKDIISGPWGKSIDGGFVRKVPSDCDFALSFIDQVIEDGIGISAAGRIGGIVMHFTADGCPDIGKRERFSRMNPYNAEKQEK